ncbi:uncharacterized protein LOC109598275 [Aethina tumida]|uniref:uncharacterized protein LOC109598275 n=1 Tax=Aethina tumida TaxID=116153 RepID=UPI00096B4BA0|nr:uncharacterized protein LOC109598275 [Aethina tumida]
MEQKGLLVLLIIVTGVVVQGQLTFRAPRISQFFDRVSNATYDIIRGGVNLFSRTTDRIINTFASVEDRLEALLNEFRKRILQGIPEFNIPVLDPLHINRIDFDVVHDAAKIKGYASNVTIRHISKFKVDKLKFTDLGRRGLKLDLNITFPYLTVVGLYKIDGEVSETFRIFGEGPFWLNLTDLSIGTSTVLKYTFPRLKVTDMNIDVKLRKLSNNFENLMSDEELGELFNKAIASLAPEALTMLWPELKAPVEKQVMKYINNILENTTIAGLARRFFNIP